MSKAYQQDINEIAYDPEEYAKGWSHGKTTYCLIADIKKCRKEKALGEEYYYWTCFRADSSSINLTQEEFERIKDKLNSEVKFQDFT